MRNKGITLIALVVSIIVLLLLAGISISMLTGDNGLLTKTATAKQATEEATELELIKLAVTAAQTAGYGSLTTENLNNELRVNFDDENATAEKIGSNWYYKEYCIEENGNVEKYDKLLPEEYQEVEYIESTGTQYIDTRFSPNNESGLILKLNYTSKPVSLSKPYGVYYDDNANRWYGLNPSDYGNKWSYGWGDWHELEINFTPGFHEISINLNNNREARLDNQSVYNLKNLSFGLGLSAYLFALNGKSNGERKPIHFSKVQLYICQIFDENLMVRSFIPCYSTTTVTDVNGKQCPKDTIGLFDTVEGNFYTNQGTGEFLKK